MSVELPDPVTLVREVLVRLMRPEERPRWDMLMDAHYHLGFKQFAGRGLRYVAEWNGEWLVRLGCQTGVIQCRPRDRWLGWHKAVQFRRPHLIGNNTRFLVLPQGEGIPNLASRAVENRNVRTSFSRIDSAVGKGLFSVYSDVLDDLDAAGQGRACRQQGSAAGSAGGVGGS